MSRNTVVKLLIMYEMKFDITLTLRSDVLHFLFLSLCVDEKSI